MRESATLRFLLAFTTVWTVGILILNIFGQQYQIHAIEKFSVFAQLAYRTRPSPPASPSADTPRKPDIDMSATASIPVATQSAYAKDTLLPATTTRLQAFQIIYVTGERALVKTPSGIVDVKVGETIQGAGKLLDVKRHKRSWILLTENGTILETTE